MTQRYARRAEVLGTSVYDHAANTIVLNSGMAYPPLLPDISREAAAAAQGDPTETMQYGPLMGLDDLRDAVCAYVAQDGVNCERDQVLITNGAKHALDLACRVYLEPGDRVIVSEPTYLTALFNMRTHGVGFLGIPQDEEGLRTEILERELKRLAANGEAMPKLMFEVPDFHNPTGITMSLARRKALIALAAEYGFVICEDDPYRRVRFDGPSIPPLKALDDAGVVIALGTVSKILSPGLRVGWAIGKSEVIRRMALQKSDGGSSPFTQRIVVDLMRSNRMGDHVEAITGQMRINRDAMASALRRDLPELAFRTPQGGYFLWGQLPDALPAEDLAKCALDHGVEVSSGRLCFPNSVPGNFLRFAYSYVEPDAIVEGIGRLSEAYKSLAPAVK